MNERNILVDRLIELNGGDASWREDYADWPLDHLCRAVESAEKATRDVAVYGHIGATWADAARSEVYDRIGPVAPKGAIE